MSSLSCGLLQLIDPAGDDRGCVVRSGCGLRMELRGARTQLGVVEAFDGSVVQRRMRDGLVVGRRDGEAVVLRGDEDAARTVIEHGMVGSAVAERQLERLAPCREREQLMPEANAEHRRPPEESLERLCLVDE